MGSRKNYCNRKTGEPAQKKWAYSKAPLLFENFLAKMQAAWHGLPNLSEYHASCFC
jgi:hypothetical protein